MFDAFNSIWLIQQLESMAQLLQRVANGKEQLPDNAFFHKWGSEISADTIKNICALVNSIIIAMNDCGAKVHPFQMKFLREIKFGEFQYKMIFVRFLMSEPLLLALFLGYLGGNFETGKPAAHIQTYNHAAFESPLCSSGFCTQAALEVKNCFTDKKLVNVNYLGAYYQNIFSLILKKMLDNSQSGWLVLNALLDNVVQIFVKKYRQKEQYEATVFMLVAMIVEMKEYEGVKLLQWLKKSNIEGKNDILSNVLETAKGESDNELDYKVAFHLLKNKQLNQLFEGSHPVTKQYKAYV